MNVPLEYREGGGKHNYPSKRRVKYQLPFAGIKTELTLFSTLVG